MRDEAKQKSLARLLTHASRAHRNYLGLKLATLGLMAGQEQILQALDASGPTSTGALAALLHVRPATVSKAVSRLSAVGLVERLPPRGGDNRMVTIGLTESGADKVRLVNKLWQETERELLAGFDTKDTKRLRKLLRRAILNLSADPEAEFAGETESDRKENAHEA